MSIRRGITVAVLALGGTFSVVQSAMPQTPSPTLKETTTWLASHLTSLVHTSKRTSVTIRTKKGKPPKEVERQEENTSETVSSAVFDGCSLKLGQMIKGDDYTVSITSLIPMDHLLKASLSTEKQDSSKSQDGDDSTEVTVAPASVIVVKLEATSNVISWKRASTGSVPLEQARIPYQGNSASLNFTSDDESLPPRILNALNHAIQLCQVAEKPEPF